MTKAEAIELLEDVIGAVEDNQGRDYDTAFRMAIKALTQDSALSNRFCRTVKDLINKQDAIKTMCNAVCEYDVLHYPDCDQIKYCDEIQALISLPSADAVEVIRCGCCEWWKCNPNTTEYGTCKKVSYDDFEVIMDSDDFCSYGVRRKDGEV